eukprot:1202804-Prymnesium_polylepis.1
MSSEVSMTELLLFRRARMRGARSLHVPFVILEQDAETPMLAKASVAAVQPESPPNVVTMKAVLMLALKPG